MGACECPLKKKVYRARNLQYVLPRLGGPLFAQIMAGNFEGSVQFVDGVTGRVFGCLGMDLAIKARKK